MSSMVEIWEPKTETAAGRKVMAVIRGVQGLGAKYIVASDMDELDRKVGEYIRDLEISEMKRATAPIRRMTSTWRNSWQKLRKGNDVDRGSEAVRPGNRDAGPGVPGAGE